MKLFPAKCQFEIEEKENQTGKNLDFYSPCILIGLFAFWPYTDVISYPSISQVLFTSSSRSSV